LEADRLGKKLANHDFMTHAPREEVEKVHLRVNEAKERVKRLEENIAALNL
jgi:valyl-tRNA synthetase